MMPKVEVHVLGFDEVEMLRWTLRHYRTFSRKIVVHDGGDGRITKAALEFREHVAKFNADPCIEIVPWDTAMQMNDDLSMQLKNTCWKGTDADWVIVADIDELIYFPEGAHDSLNRYEKMGAVVIKPHGYEMFSETFPTGLGQIYDEIKDGAPDDVWYAKPILFSAKRVAESGFGVGAHESRPVLKNGMALGVGPKWPKANPPCWLLHYHQIGPIEDVGRRYDEVSARLSAINIKMTWGKRPKGVIHAQEKRDLILPNLRRLIP